MQEKLGGEIGGEIANHLVEFCNLVDVPLACHGDAILSTFELALKIAEPLIRLEVGIILGQGKQPPLETS